MTKNESLLFLPLGGAGEIGMNLNLYGYKNQWLMVDLGITFNHVPGIDIIVPDPAFIAEQRHKLQGLLITHGHEDHIGAIPHLWRQLECPIYATPFTMSLIRNKLQEAGLMGQVPLHEVALNSRFNVGHFDVEYIGFTHSIPEPNMIAIRTSLGTVLHTGDWKIDTGPVLESHMETDRLRALGDEGVLALVCDSTNVFEKGMSGSEQSVQEGLLEVAGKHAKVRIVVSCFASNVARLKSCAIVAEKLGRQIALVGRSMLKIEEAARKCGYLENLPPFISEKEAMALPRNQVMIVCTGSQGEPRSALYRIANQTHGNIKLSSGDITIFSSRVIPGNEMEIGHVKNLLVEHGVKIITNRAAQVHVSGHPCEGELKELYSWIRPKIAIPVHGEFRHLQHHAELAKSWGVETAIIIRNGECLNLAPQTPKVTRHVHHGRLGVDGFTLVPMNGHTVHERAALGAQGVVFVTLDLKNSSKKQFAARLSLMGVFEQQDEALQREMAQTLKGALSDMQPLAEYGEAKIKEQIKKHLRNYFKKNFDKKPTIMIHTL